MHQNPNDGVVLDMTVAENLALDTLTDRGSPRVRAAPDRGPRAGGGRRRSGCSSRAGGLRSPVRDLGVSDRQLLVLARALSRRPEILILDEPTSALSADEAERLFDLVRSLRAGGMTALFVSHKLAEIDQLADRSACCATARCRASSLRARGEHGLRLAGRAHRALRPGPGGVDPGGEPGRVRRARSCAGVQLAEDTEPFDLDLPTAR